MEESTLSPSQQTAQPDWWQRQTTLTKALVISVPVGFALLALVLVIVISLRTSRPMSGLRRRSALGLHDGAVNPEWLAAMTRRA